MGRATVLMILLLAVPVVYATDYTVGDSSGWGTGVDYTSWTSGKTFTVGDKLVFSYGGTHSLDQVSKSDYDSCTAGNSLKSYSGGSNTITLDKQGSFYFLCPTFGHCGQGMKLAVTVSAAAGSTPSTPTTPSTPSTPGSPGTPPNTNTPAATPSPRGNGAARSFTHTSGLLLGASLLMAPLLGLMG